MNKAAIKNFAIWARNKLIADVSYDARLIGITEDGIAKPLPQSFGGTQFFDIGTAEPYSISGEAVRQRDKLIEVIQQKEKDTDYKTAYQYVIEEVAYTWFNRLIAIRFMEVNDYLPSHIRVLSSESGKLEPDLVTTPFDAELPFTAEGEAQIFQLKQDNKLDEVFRILFLKQCNALNEILPALFEKTKNYTELLLSLSVIDQDGVVYHLIHDIPEDDFNIERGGQVEIIGWLYQYYNTEPKAAAFAKSGKITKEEIPAVTQLFTPDWIVRYMVESYAQEQREQGNTALADTLLDICDTPVSPELLPPTSEGVIAQKTEETIGSYDLHDFFLYHLLRNHFAPRKIYALAKIAFSDRDPSLILSTLKTFYRRFFTQQFKRNCMPDGVKVGSVCLSPRGDWRMPSDASFALWMNELEEL